MQIGRNLFQTEIVLLVAMRATDGKKALALRLLLREPRRRGGRMAARQKSRGHQQDEPHSARSLNQNNLRFLHCASAGIRRTPADRRDESTPRTEL